MSVRWRWLALLVVSLALFLLAGHARGLLAPAGARGRAPSAVGAGAGIPIGGRPAPGFALVDQFGRRVALRSLRGREVVLAFIDSRCTTVCPLTAAILRGALRRLGAGASRRVALVAVNANPTATRSQTSTTSPPSIRCSTSGPT